MPKSAFLGVAATCLVVAMFQAWRDQYERAVRAEVVAASDWQVLVRVTWVSDDNYNRVGLHLVNRSKTTRMDFTFSERVTFTDDTKAIFGPLEFEKFNLPEHVTAGPGEPVFGELWFYPPARRGDAPPDTRVIKTRTLVISEHVSGKSFELLLTKAAEGAHVWV